MLNAAATVLSSFRCEVDEVTAHLEHSDCGLYKTHSVVGLLDLGCVVIRILLLCITKNTCCKCF